MTAVINRFESGIKRATDCACIPAGYKTNDVEKLRLNAPLAAFPDLELGVIIKLPPPAYDNFEAENHENKLGETICAFKEKTQIKKTNFFISLILDQHVYEFCLKHEHC